MYLDNFKIKTKLIIIYIVCVLIPMVVTDSFFCVYGYTECKPAGTGYYERGTWQGYE